jgi:Putative NADPH-quinone reductase (modulator of drug activity B)
MINYTGARMYVNIFLILAYPNPHSFNHAIADVANRALLNAGHTVLFHDLYQEGFDPVLTSDEIPRDGSLSHEVFIHCDEIAMADGIIVVHPNWWECPCYNERVD